MKNVSLRTCVVTRNKLPKEELIRVLRTPEGNVIIDESGKANGRGAYIKKDAETIKKAKKALGHHLGVQIPDDLIENLIATIKD